jgi:phenylacetate-CoA ligase
VERASQANQLRVQLRHVHETSPLYRRKWEGIDVASVREPADLAVLPFTEKDELRESQERVPPLGETQGVPLAEISRIQCTGGTTGIPMRIPLGRDDLDLLDEVGARCIACMGGGPGDLLFECMNYSLYVGGVTDHLAFERAGVCVLPYGVGNTQRLLELVRALATPWCLYSTPAYALRLAQVAREQGLEPRELGMAKGFFSGEAGLQLPGFRAAIEDTWGCVARDLYGLSETGCMAAECGHMTGLHLLTGDAFVTELIDPESGAVLTPAAGAVGELVFTNLRRRAGYLVRYRSHDVVRIASGACPCGRDGLRFILLGRSDDMFIVRGVNVFPLGVQDVLDGLRPAVTGEFRIVLDRPPPIDYAPRLIVERGTGPEDDHELVTAVTRAIHSRLNFTPAVEIVPPESLARSEGKTRRLERAY